jgi:ABC-type transport system involved in cytochrome c biogenesis permease subunit
LKKILLTFLLLFSQLMSNEINLLQEVPTSYNGRFRPLDATARLWLSNNYNNVAIKSKHYTNFHMLDSSAVSLLWKLQFCGYANWTDSPLFWVYSSDLKTLLNLPLKENYFSYDQLHNAIYDNQTSNLALVKKLVSYNFLKAYHNSSNRSGTEKQELAQLSPGLWASGENGRITIVEAPKNPLWQYVKPGMVIADNADQLKPSLIKEGKPINDEISKLLQLMNQFSGISGPYAAGEKEYEKAYAGLKARNNTPGQIEEILQREFPLAQRLKQAGSLFKVLPGKDGEWISLNALTMKIYNKKSNALDPIANFTVYSDSQFSKIQDTYYKLIYDHNDVDLKHQLAALLIDNYKNEIENKPIHQTSVKEIRYPSFSRLKAEQFYYQVPLIETTIITYGLAIISLMIGLGQKRRRFTHFGLILVLIAFCLNTLVLALRCYVLGRPPVSNMFETIIYVPWVAVLVSLILRLRMRNSIIVLGASITALALLIVLQVTGLADGMENVQAVLESQYWLIIHVLMIVGSYGVFALAGILGEIYLIQYLRYKHETFMMEELGNAILQSMYIGVALLIPGTILGGVWAAQSWGRFWDWDPKESWAFISSCIYVIFIHTYTFKHIRFFGLAMGAVLGLLAISFTWYGVNYILGTGLHSYGFGSGGDLYYYAFILAEISFLAWAALIRLYPRGKSFEKK